jgi:hypothetical protein
MDGSLENTWHMDTVGPSQVRSIRGKWYVLVIVDDYSRYSLVFFMESKDEVFEHFWRLTFTIGNREIFVGQKPTNICL